MLFLLHLSCTNEKLPRRSQYTDQLISIHPQNTLFLCAAWGGEEHQVPGPMVFLHCSWRHFLFFSWNHPHFSAGGDWRPQPSSRSGGWHHFPPIVPGEVRGERGLIGASFVGSKG